MGGIPARDACVTSAIAAQFMAMASQNTFPRQDKPAARAEYKDNKGKPEADNANGKENGGKRAYAAAKA